MAELPAEQNLLFIICITRALMSSCWVPEREDRQDYLCLKEPAVKDKTEQ